MAYLIIAPALLLLAAAVGVMYAVLRRVALRRRVLVSLLDGKALNGVLWARRGALLVLKDVTLHERGVDPIAVDGEVLVERSRVDFVQVL